MGFRSTGSVLGIALDSHEQRHGGATTSWPDHRGHSIPLAIIGFRKLTRALHNAMAEPWAFLRRRLQLLWCRLPWPAVNISCHAQ